MFRLLEDMASNTNATVSQMIKTLHVDNGTLLEVMECHHIFLASVQGNLPQNMIESTYQSIQNKPTNWKRNVEFLKWLKSADSIWDLLTSRTYLHRLHEVLQIMREDNQEHVENSIDDRTGE